MLNANDVVVKVSVIIPCYNMGPLLVETLESVARQTYKDYETIVIDDGSSDVETVEILRNVKVPNGRVVKTENTGLPSARNYGISFARGRYILPLDSDDTIHPDYLSKTVSILDEDTEIRLGFVTTNYRFFDGKNIKGIPKNYDPIALAVENCIPITSLFRKKCWEEVGGYEKNLRGYQDWNFWIQIVAKGYRWEVLREELFYYRDRKGSMLKGSDQIRGELAAQIYDLNRAFYEKNSEEIIKAYGHRLGQMWNKVRGCQSHEREIQRRWKALDSNWWIWLGRLFKVVPSGH